MKTNLIILLATIGIAAHAQTISNHAILSSGSSFDQPGLVGNASIGQTAIITLGSSGLILTQGILQGEIPDEITSIPNALDISSELLVYPNPASDFINLSISNTRNQTYYIDLFDIQGNTLISVLSKLDRSGSSKIDFRSYKSGLYILRVRSGDNKEQGFLKVLKND